MISSAIILKQYYSYKDEKSYNLEKWLRKSLLDLGILNQVQIDALCCPTKTTIFMQKDTLFFGNEDLKSEINLKKRLKVLLTEWGIVFTDPCCP